VRIGRFETLPSDARQVVSGSQQVVTNGRATGHGDKLAPHTVAGINADGTKLTLLVVDGRLMSHSVGMNEAQLAREMLKLGCTDAVNLDGGGSSTLVMRKTAADEWVLMNRPSDGHDLPIPLSIERNVACVLGVRLNR
jgi:exopolysaccharide biosynthesis protein